MQYDRRHAPEHKEQNDRNRRRGSAGSDTIRSLNSDGISANDDSKIKTQRRVDDTLYNS